VAEETSAVRTTRWPLGTDAERAVWDHWSGLVQSGRHPTLARVAEAVRTDSQATLVLVDPDSEDVIAWAARTGASVPQRLAVLRAAAAALDSLYAGTTFAAGLPHGGLSTAAVRVDSDGAARLVDFSPWTSRETDQERFRAPEVAAGTPATRAGDVYAFARLVAEVLGGPAVADATDVSSVMRALRANADTRRRPRLVKAIQAALSSPPEARPQPLLGWLTAAVEGTAATEVTGAIEVTDPEQVAPPAARPRRAGLALTTAVIAVVVGLAAWALHNHGRTPARASPPTTSNPTASTGPFTATAAWAPPCGADTGIAAAYRPDALTRPTTAAALDAAPAATGVGRWHTGRLLITLIAPSGDQPVLITDIEARPVGTTNGPPTWVAQSETCGSATTPEGDVGYRVDLDRDRTARISHGSDDRFSQKGSFALLTTPTVIALDVTACDANYAWEARVAYSVGDMAGMKRLGPFFTYGQAGAAGVYTLGSGRSTPRLRIGTHLVSDCPSD
jgi:hypothetical protein